MNCWCRLCRKWVYQDHFLQLKPGWGMRTYDACGNGRDDIRYHPENPLCGDVWKMRDGRYMVVDYIDSFSVGVTFSDGQRSGVGYRCSFAHHVKGAELISTFEEWPYHKCDHRGWTRREKDKSTAEDSLAFLRRVLKRKEQEAEITHKETNS